MNSKYRQLFPKAFLALLSIAMALTVLAIYSISSALSAQAAKDNSSDFNNPKSQNTSIIRTSNLEQTRTVAKSYGLKEVNVSTLPKGEAFLTVNAPISHLGLQMSAWDMRHDPSFKVSPNHDYRLLLEPNDPNYQNGDQWNLNKINAPAAWDITTGSEDVVIAVIDTGVLSSQSWTGSDVGDCPPEEPCEQPDFPAEKMWVNPNEVLDGTDTSGNGFIDDVNGWDFMGGWRGDSAICPNHNDSAVYEHPENSNFLRQDNDPQPYSCDNPNNPSLLNMNHYEGACPQSGEDIFRLDRGACYIGHGTIVASVSASATNNLELVAGIDWNAKIMNIRVLDGYGWGDSARVAAGIEYAADMGADVINLSLAVFDAFGSCTSIDSTVESALQKAANAGVVVVAASGNGGGEGVCYPARSEHAMAVGASNSSDQRASFSTYGSHLDVLAPGVGIPAANAPAKSNGFNNYHSGANGTSLATPHVAGLAALIKSVSAGYSVDQITKLITDGARKVSGMGGANFHKEYGYGRIDANRTVALSSLTHPSGTLVRESGNPRIYLVENNQRRYISSRPIFDSHKFRLSRVRNNSVNTMNLPEGSPLGYREGTLLQGSGSAVYVVGYDGGQMQKRHITSRSVFDSLGYSFDEIMKVTDSQLPTVNGPDINNSSVHPDGTLIRASGDTKVYLIEDGKRRHISTRPAFNSHEFTFDQVKQATNQDMNMPTASSLSFRDGTLIQGGSAPVYVVSYQANQAQKRHIKSRWVFDALDLSFSDVLKVNNSQLPTQNGDPIE